MDLMTDLPLLLLSGVFNVLLVILGIGLLIFIHELGHFLVAKWNKVRVEAFSLGFGPVVWGFRRGDTHYRLSLIPLGGYVKMAGEMPGDEAADDPGALNRKSVGARAAIYSAGVIMNALLAIVLFVFAFRVGVPLPAPVVGAMRPGGEAWRVGLEPGDRILAIDGAKVLDFEDVHYEIAFADGPVDLTIERNGETIEFEDVDPMRDSNLGVRRLDVQIAVDRRIEVEEDSAAAKAGFRDGDEILSVDGVDWVDQAAVARRLAKAEGPVRFEVRRSGEIASFPVTPEWKQAPESARYIGIQPALDQVGAVRLGSAPAAAGFRGGDRFVAVNGVPTPTYDVAVAAAEAAGGPATFTVERGGEKVEIGPVDRPAEGFREWLSAVWPEPSSTGSTRISLTSGQRFDGPPPAAAAGIVEGSQIVEVNGQSVASFDEIREIVGGGSAVRVKWIPPGETVARGPVEVVPRASHYADFGFTSRPVAETVRLDSVGAAIGAGVRRSILTGQRILTMLGGLLTGRYSSKNLGGPVAIFQISMDSAERDFLYFLYFLGVLSVNLAILNILPIPVLDGGHLLFVLIEAIRRKPLSERTMAAFQWAGFLFLILLMAFVIVQDVGRIID